MSKKSAILALALLQAVQLIAEPIDFERIEEHSASKDLERFLDLNGTVHVTGYAINWKRTRTFILIDRIRYTGVELYPVKDGGSQKIRSTQTFEIKGLARISQLIQWPKEYENKRILLSGFLKKDPPPKKEDLIEPEDTDPALFPYAPYSFYYFDSYTWELIE